MSSSKRLLFLHAHTGSSGSKPWFSYRVEAVLATIAIVMGVKIDSNPCIPYAIFVHCQIPALLSLIHI